MIAEEIRKGLWNGLATYRAYLDGKPVGMLQPRKSLAQRDLEMAKQARMASLCPDR